MMFCSVPEINETTETTSSALLLDIYLKFDTNGQLSTRLYDKRDDFNFAIINFLPLDRNAPIRRLYSDVSQRCNILSSNLLNQ